MARKSTTIQAVKGIQTDIDKSRLNGDILNNAHNVTITKKGNQYVLTTIAANSTYKTVNNSNFILGSLHISPRLHVLACHTVSGLDSFVVLYVDQNGDTQYERVSMDRPIPWTNSTTVDLAFIYLNQSYLVYVADGLNAF